MLIFTVKNKKIYTTYIFNVWYDKFWTKIIDFSYVKILIILKVLNSLKYPTYSMFLKLKQKNEVVKLMIESRSN